MKGRMAAPVLVVEYPCTWIKSNGNRKKKIPTAEYKNNVSKFAPEKVREPNRLSGNIGVFCRSSTRTNKIKSKTPPIKLATTQGFLQPRFTDSINPPTRPPSPKVTKVAPNQSI